MSSKHNHQRLLCSLKLSTVSYKKLKWEYPNYQWNQGIRLRTNWDKCFGYTIIHFLLLSRSTTKNMYIRVCERNSCHLNGEFSPTCLLMKFELTEYLGCCECLRCLFLHSPSHNVSVQGDVMTSLMIMRTYYQITQNISCILYDAWW